MTGVIAWMRRRFFPPLPEDIRDDVAILRANRIETLTPMLFLMLAATTPTAIYGGMPSVHPIIRIGFPVVLAAVCLIGFAAQMHYRGRRMSPRRARCQSTNTKISSAGRTNFAACSAARISRPASSSCR